jgi:recombination protein RecR
MSNDSSDLDRLIHLVAKLPGLGPRSAKRVVLHLLKQKDSVMRPLAESLASTADNTLECEICGNLDVFSPCHICTDEKRDASQLCVVEDVADLWAFERGSIYRGRYHVLGGVLSAMDGVGPADLNVETLVSRAREEVVNEVILATNATVDGQTTAYYLTELLQDIDIEVTRLAHGIPIGGELDYLDEGTLSAALKSRKVL